MTQVFLSCNEGGWSACTIAHNMVDQSLSFWRWDSTPIVQYARRSNCFNRQYPGEMNVRWIKIDSCTRVQIAYGGHNICGGKKWA